MDKIRRSMQAPELLEENIRLTVAFARQSSQHQKEQKKYRADLQPDRDGELAVNRQTVTNI